MKCSEIMELLEELAECLWACQISDDKISDYNPYQARDPFSADTSFYVAHISPSGN